MGAPGLSDDRLIGLALAALAIACVVGALRLIRRPGRRAAGVALLALGLALAAVLYVFATFTIRLF